MSSLNPSHEADRAIRVQARVRLTAREFEILGLVADGHRSKDAADILFVSKRTVDFHIANVFRKLGVKNRLRAISAARRLGVLPFEPPFIGHQRR